MTEYEKFIKSKKKAAIKMLIGFLLFLAMALFMFISFTGTDFGILSFIVGIPIPLGCIFLSLILLWTSNQIHKMLAWPPPLSGDDS